MIISCLPVIVLVGMFFGKFLRKKNHLLSDFRRSVLVHVFITLDRRKLAVLEWVCTGFVYRGADLY